MILVASKIVLENFVLEDGFVEVIGERITRMGKRERLLEDDFVAFDFSGATILPGLIDLHVHGAMGFDAMHGASDLYGLSAALAAQGIVGYCPTTVTESDEAVLEALKAIQGFKSLPEPLGAKVLGAYVEGPFLSAAFKGAHPEGLLKAFDLKLLEKWQRESEGVIKVLALAPERLSDMGEISAIRALGMEVALGHSGASFEMAQSAIGEGAKIGVHLFNGMCPIHHRHPGIVTAFLLEDSTFAELIVDGIHLHEAAVRLAIKSKGVDRIVLISDSMCAAGLADGPYRLGQLSVEVSDGIAKTESGSLAGSTLRLMDAVKRVAGFEGLCLSSAAKMASLNPATVLGLGHERGSIACGKFADLTVVTDDFEVIGTLLEGRWLYQTKGNKEV